MSLDPHRVLATLDEEIDAARRTLDHLTASRQAYAAAHGITGRKAAPSPDGESAPGSLMTAVLRVMADGEWRHLDDVLALLEKEGRSTRKGTLNTLLARGAGEGGLLERGRRGMYRVRPEVVARWAHSIEATHSDPGSALSEAQSVLNHR